MDPFQCYCFSQYNNCCNQAFCTLIWSLKGVWCDEALDWWPLHLCLWVWGILCLIMMLFIDLDFDGFWVKMWTDLSICVSAFDYTAWLKILLVDLVLEWCLMRLLSDLMLDFCIWFWAVSIKILQVNMGLEKCYWYSDIVGQPLDFCDQFCFHFASIQMLSSSFFADWFSLTKMLGWIVNRPVHLCCCMF